MKTLAIATLTLIGIAALPATEVFAGADIDPNTQFTLLCKASVNGQLFTKNLEIDYRKNKVDGANAVITNTMITWSTNDFDVPRQRSAVTRHELNRLAGSYRQWSEGAIYASPPPTYACEKAPQAKF